MSATANSSRQRLERNHAQDEAAEDSHRPIAVATQDLRAQAPRTWHGGKAGEGAETTIEKIATSVAPPHTSLPISPPLVGAHPHSVPAAPQPRQYQLQPSYPPQEPLRSPNPPTTTR